LRALSYWLRGTGLGAGYATIRGASCQKQDGVYKGMAEASKTETVQALVPSEPVFERGPWGVCDSIIGDTPSA
jgi:hypothetical protein